LKKRIAVWIYGGIGTGHFAQGYPMLEKLLEKLSATFDIVVYSHAAPHPNYRSEFFQIRSAPKKITTRFTRWAYLIKYFIRDHWKTRFQILFAFWGYPSGVLVTSLGKVMNLPSVVYLLGSDSAGISSINFGILHKPLYRYVAKWAYRSASLLLTISRFQSDSLTKYGIVRPIVVIPWGADASSYQFQSRKRGDVLHVIHVGHLTPVKDQSTLLKAFALLVQHHPAELRIFGGDAMSGQIQNVCLALNIDKYVKFLDMIPYHQMPEQYAWADVMFHTSLSEGQSMALTEAAACGVLLAGTRVGLLYDLGNDYGVVIEPGDYRKLSEEVLSLIQKSDEWKRKVELARLWSQDHDLNWTVRELEKTLSSLFK
jgi:glycosyltransferase involved in cell wall biosynthesis